MRNIERIGRVGAAVALGIALNFGIDQKGEGSLGNAPNCPSGYSPIGGCLPTPTPEIHIPTHTPTPDIQATIQAGVRATIEARPIQAPVSPTSPNIIIIPPQVNPGPETEVIVVKPEVVKPEIVKPEVIQVPQIMTVQVPVEATPNPEIIRLRQQETERLIESKAKEIAEATMTAQAIQATAQAKNETTQATVEPTATPISVPGSLRDDWGHWWTYFAVAATALVVGAAIGFRDKVRTFFIREERNNRSTQRPARPRNAKTTTTRESTARVTTTREGPPEE